MQAEQLKDLVINALEDVKAQDISVIDVRDRTSVTDFMVLASGTSNRHVKSLADSVVIEAKEQGVRASNVEGAGVSDWILVDLGDVVVHVMMPATREFYDLERFWRDAPDLGVAGDRVIALEVGGRPWSTEKLATQLENWQQDGRDVSFLVGGPDGLAEDCRNRADQQWSLSALTLPHPLVRIVLAEQLYRAWSITRNHPYHRA